MAERTAQLDLDSWSETDRKWAERFTYVLAMHTSLPAEKVGTAVEEARQLCRDAGESAQTLFGEPDAAAQNFAAEHVSAGNRADERIFQPVVALTVACWTTAWLLFLLTWFVIDYGTWAIPKSLTLAAIAAAIFAVTATGALAYSAVSLGRITRAVVTGLVGLVPVGASFWWLATVGETAQQPLPFWVPLLAALFLGAAGLGLIVLELKREVARGDAIKDTRDWFVQLEGYLRGQQLLTKKEARAVVLEAKQHFAQVQADTPAQTPEQEFGSARAYAEKYARSMRRFDKRQQGRKALIEVGQSLLFLVFALFLAAHWGWNLWGWLLVTFASLLFLMMAVAEYKKFTQK